MNLPANFDNILILTIALFLYKEGVEDMTTYIALFLVFIA